MWWYQGVGSIPLAFISDIGVSSTYFVCFLAFLILCLVGIFECRFFLKSLDSESYEHFYYSNCFTDIQPL